MKGPTGRPLRALALAATAGTLWFASRMPQLAERYTAALQAMQPAVAAPPPFLAYRASAPPPPIAIRLPRPANATNAMIAPRHGSVASRAQSAKQAVPVPPASRPASQAIYPVAVLPSPHAPTTPHDLAAQAYARLAAQDRRGADSLFGAAIAAGEGDPNLGAWRRERRRLNRRWSGDAYILLRDSGTTGAAASPVLGGGQSGAAVAFAVDPLARRPLAVIARVYAAHDTRNLIDGDTAQAAVGLRWQIAPGVSIAAERLIAIGAATSGDWNLRVAAGGERRLGPVRVTAYGEAGARGNGNLYAGGQARAALPVARIVGIALDAGPGVWGSIDAAAITTSRVDLGIGATGRLGGAAISADWRWRVAGNAAPGSGPAVTISAAF